MYSRRNAAWPDAPTAGSQFEAAIQPAMPWSDEFDGDRLGLQWQFHQHLDEARYALDDGALLLHGFGESAGTARPLAMMAMHRAYEVETDVELAGDGSAGLMLFGSPEVFIGLALGPDGTLRRVQEGFRRYRSTDEPAIARKRVALRIVNDKQDVRFYYGSGEGEWVVLQPGMDVSSMTTVGWHALRPALFATGAARARFVHFRYCALAR